MIITIILICLIVWLTFFSTSPYIGKHLLTLNNNIEAIRAGLKRHECNNKDRRFIYYSNSTKPDFPTLILLHGFSADKSIWLKFAKYVTKDFNLIIPDLLGHGENIYDHSLNYSAYTQAEYVEDLLVQLNLLDNIAIVGNSMGGMIGAIMTQNQLNNRSRKTSNPIRSLILIDPAGARTEFAEKLKQDNIVPFEHAKVSSVYEFFNLTMHKPPFVPPSVLAYIAKHQYVDKKEQLRQMFLDFFNPDEFFSQPLKTNELKILLIWGVQDKLLPVSEAKAWEQLVQSEALFLNDIGHMPMVECPKIVADHIKQQIYRT